MGHDPVLTYLGILGPDRRSGPKIAEIGSKVRKKCGHSSTGLVLSLELLENLDSRKDYLNIRLHDT